MQITKKVSGAFKIDILYLMFVVMSGFFWQERMINQDNALFSFNITAFESFELAHSRFTDIFSQVIPILLTKAGFSLNTILLSYSVALVLIPYLLFRAVLYTYKDKGMAWMLFLAQILFVSEYFFDAISESKGAIALCLFLIATLKNKNCFNNMKTFYTIGFLILLFALFTHPVSVLLIGILLFWAFANHSIDKRDNYLFFGLLIALAVLKHFLFPTTGYENDLIHQIINPAEWSDVLHDNYVLSFVMAKFREIYLFGLIFILFFFGCENHGTNKPFKYFSQSIFSIWSCR